jgi:hypothetical protein
MIGFADPEHEKWGFLPSNVLQATLRIILGPNVDIPGRSIPSMKFLKRQKHGRVLRKPGRRNGKIGEPLDVLPSESAFRKSTALSQVFYRSPHGLSDTCLTYTQNPRWCPSEKNILFSGQSLGFAASGILQAVSRIILNWNVDIHGRVTPSIKLLKKQKHGCVF